MKENVIGMPPVLSGMIILEMDIMVVQLLLYHLRIRIHIRAHAQKARVPTKEKPPVAIKVVYLVNQLRGTPPVVHL